MKHPMLLAAAAVAMAPVAPLAAHHGWAWAADEEFALDGVVISVRERNPHGEMQLKTASGAWTVEIGQPWRNAQAGLTTGSLKPGVALRVHGHRSANKAQRLMKAERIVIGAKSYNLYPDRPS
ncbi:MAG TPA: DUF6152 family protein [Sphingomonas sp.]|nr:DUF6152 family protein [Sphingomonas sp.]